MNNANNMVARKIIFAASCVLALALFVAHETLLNFYPGTGAARNVIKFFISAIPFCLSAFAWKSNKSPFVFFVTLGLFACCVGDVVINIAFVLSVALYLVGHSLFVKGFFCCKKPRAFQFVLWGTLFAAICVWLIFFTNVPMKEKIEGCVYSIFMCAMVAFSFCGPVLVCAGEIIFGISDILLIVNILIGVETGAAHVLSLGIYYVGVFLMAANIFLQNGAQRNGRGD